MADAVASFLGMGVRVTTIRGSVGVGVTRFSGRGVGVPTIVARAVAVCIGPHGIGRWQEVEYFAAYQRFIEGDQPATEPGMPGGGVRIVPVLLPGARERNVPVFARQLVCVDLRVRGETKHRGQVRKLVQAILSATSDR